VDLDVDAVLLDAGGVLVLPDPTVLGPLLAPYGGDPSIDRHRRAHYAAMAVKSRRGGLELDWDAYDEAYVRSVGVADDLVDIACELLGACRVPHLWRWPIPESLVGLRRLHAAGIPVGVVSNASGQVEAMLARAGVCQVGDGTGVPVLCIVDSHVVGVAKPDPAIFEFATRRLLGIEPARIAYVGDSVPIDIAVAAAAGMVPVLLDPYDDHVDAEFRRIAALGELLDLRAKLSSKTHTTVTKRVLLRP
jgi:putative hydrolase of the HAD superfamily